MGHCGVTKGVTIDLLLKATSYTDISPQREGPSLMHRSSEMGTPR